jgi:hypothetical protein
MVPAPPGSSRVAGEAQRGRDHLTRRTGVAKFKVVTPAGVSYGMAGAEYTLEMEALGPLGVEIVEVSAGTEDEFVKAGKDADALYAKGRRITKRMIDGLERCKVISLGSVGVDSVDVAAATARGIPVTNVPDTFIEEVADHAMMLILATFRRLVVQDRLVREGRWKEGRPMLLPIPRLMGQTLGLIAFGHVARAVATRARAFGVHMLAYDPYIEELVMSPYGVEPVGLTELLRALHQHRSWAHRRRGGSRQGPAGRLDRRGRARRPRAGAACPVQPSARHDQRDPHRSRGVGVGSLRCRAPAPGGPRDRAGVERQVAAELCEPLGAGEVGSQALAALLHGARAGGVVKCGRMPDKPTGEQACPEAPQKGYDHGQGVRSFVRVCRCCPVDVRNNGRSLPAGGG